MSPKGSGGPPEAALGGGCPGRFWELQNAARGRVGWVGGSPFLRFLSPFAARMVPGGGQKVAGGGPGGEKVRK